MVITIYGTKGAVEFAPADNDSAVDFAMAIIRNGYDVRINGVHVAISYESAGDVLVWNEGDLLSRNVLEGTQS